MKIHPNTYIADRTMIPRGHHRKGMAAAVLMIVVFGTPGCRSTGGTRDDDRVTVAQIEELRSMEALLPLAPDSILQLYRRYEPRTFYAEFTPRIETVRALIDSLNGDLDLLSRIDTLAIDHTLENFGTAARTGKTLYLSSSYFFTFRDPAVLRAAVMHEFGHIRYENQTEARKAEVASIWNALRASALLYIFRDGEYSGNARFGGHPEESPEELYASAFNLFWNRREELEARFRYVDDRYLPLFRDLQRCVVAPADFSR